MNIIEKVQKTTEELMVRLQLTGDITVEEKAGDGDHTYLQININGDDISSLIGYHGRNLESLQTVLSLMLQSELREENKRLIIEVNNYREDRAEYIKSVARRAAMEVVQSRQSMELSPMKAFERRIVHMVVKEEESGLESESIGEGEERRVIIKLIK